MGTVQGCLMQVLGGVSRQMKGFPRKGVGVSQGRCWGGSGQVWGYLNGRGVTLMGSGRYLNGRRLQGFPVVGLQLVQLVKLEADVLDGQLQHIPEPGQVLGDRPRPCVWVLSHHTHTHTHTQRHSHTQRVLIRHVIRRGVVRKGQSKSGVVWGSGRRGTAPTRFSSQSSLNCWNFWFMRS